MRVTLVIGLPASGKSTWARAQYPSATILDDPKELGEVDRAMSEMPAHLVIIDQNLCDPFVERAASEILDEIAEVDKVYFENDVEACFNNARARLEREPEKTVEGQITQLSRLYDPPRVDVRVWRPEE